MKGSCQCAQDCESEDELNKGVVSYQTHTEALIEAMHYSQWSKRMSMKNRMRTAEAVHIAIGDPLWSV